MTGFHICFIKEANLSGQLWDFTCSIWVQTEFVDLNQLRLETSEVMNVKWPVIGVHS